MITELKPPYPYHRDSDTTSKMNGDDSTTPPTKLTEEVSCLLATKKYQPRKSGAGFEDVPKHDLHIYHFLNLYYDI